MKLAIHIHIVPCVEPYILLPICLHGMMLNYIGNFTFAITFTVF